MNPTDEGGNDSTSTQSTSQETLAPKQTISEDMGGSQVVDTTSTKKTDDVAAAFDDLFNN